MREGELRINNDELLMKSASELVVVVMPAFNEGKHIAQLIQKLLVHNRKVVVVNDGSVDATADIARQAGAYVVSHLVNCGPGAATQTGLNYAYTIGAHYVITFDADGQHDPEDIEKIIAFIKKEQKDVVFGSRFLQKNTVPLLRRLANFAGNIITFLLSGIYLSDSQSGFKVFSRKALESIQITANGFEFCTEIVREVADRNLSYAEFPIRVYYSSESLSKGQNLSTGIVTVFKLIVRSLMR